MRTIFRTSTALLVASLALVSCTKQDAMENVPDSIGDTRTIMVSFFANSTKTSLDVWQPKFIATDVIKISNGSVIEDCPVDTDGSGNASITTSLTGALIAVYPASAAKMSGNAIVGFYDAPDVGGSVSSLPLEYDAARANWGGGWKIPDKDEYIGCLIAGTHGMDTI